MVQGIKNIWLVLNFLWTFRRFVWRALCEFDSISKYTGELSAAYKAGSAHFDEAQVAVESLLDLKALQIFVETTASKDDDQALEKIKKAVDNTLLFRVAWRILHGDWNVHVEQSRWSKFVEGVKQHLPFVDRTKAVKALAVASEDQPLLTEAEEAGVTSIIGIIVIILNVLPYILDFIKKRRENKCY